MTIGERILERAKIEVVTGPDWFANQLYSELSESADVRLPEVGELCFFSYTAQFPDKYPYYDRRPLVYVMDFQADKMLGGNLHYLNPDYRDGIAKGLINKVGAILPKKTLHRYFLNNIGDIFIIPPDPEEYESVAQLVTENFSNKYGQKVSPQKAWDSI
tara:strand:- start:1826 stop:2302 length:477 start_codon:yes stop_codon:yes gene_type:complete